MLLIPAATVGITIGGLTARWVNEDFVRLLVGIIAVVFTLYRWRSLRQAAKSDFDRHRNAAATRSKQISGSILGSLCGFHELSCACRDTALSGLHASPRDSSKADLYGYECYVHSHR